MASTSESLRSAATRRRLILILLILLPALRSPGQVENLSATHPVYDFLRRMEVRGIVERYPGAVLPLPRSEIARLLAEAADRSASLSETERGLLADFEREFRFDGTGDTRQMQTLIGGEGVGKDGAGLFADRERFLYARHDSVLSFFANGILEADARAGRGDRSGREEASFLRFGARARGTISRMLGFSIEATNAQFWGSRELLGRDPAISQLYALRTRDAQNFDNVDASVRFASGIVSAQVARDRVLWGYGADQQMILSDNVRTYDHLRADVAWGGFRYIFLHGWLLGRPSTVPFAVPPDTVARFTEPVVADKYVAAHRIQLSFPGVIEAGAQEVVIYSNRSVDLAYLTPLTIIESAQRARGERDNVMWAFDLKTLFLNGVQVHATAFFDDLHLGEFFSDRWYNRYAWQAGILLTDPLGVRNVTVTGEYTRVEPWVFAHNRSRENDYGSDGRVLGPRIGPNADSWFGRVDILAARNLLLSLRVIRVRQGRNPVDSTGAVVRNVGGDVLRPHAEGDPLTKVFLDGTLLTTTRIELRASWEPLHQLWLQGFILYERAAGGTPGESGIFRAVRMNLRLDI